MVRESLDFDVRVDDREGVGYGASLIEVEIRIPVVRWEIPLSKLKTKVGCQAFHDKILASWSESASEALKKALEIE